MKRIATLMMATVLLSAMIGCDMADTTTSPDTAIEDPTGAWELQSFQLSDGSIVPIPDPSSYTLLLGVDEVGRANVQADCNRCFGDYEVTGSTLTFGVMGCTLAACPPGSLENDYRFALGTASTFARTSNELTLVYDEGELVFHEQ